MTATFYIGDALETMAKLPPKSVDLILTSPPFLALRSYLPTDHELKAKEGGSQATPGEYIDWLIDFAEACDRVLAPHGSLCVELGDTYAGSSSASREHDPADWAEGETKWGRTWDGTSPKAIPRISGTPGSPGGNGWPLAKSLSLIPELFRFSLVYGFNPLTGRQTERWRLRNVVRWVRPNPPVGALGDKFRPATSELMVFCKSAKRYFDLDAVREPAAAASMFTAQYRDERKPDTKGGRIVEGEHRFTERLPQNPAGAPPLDWWNLPLLEGEEETRYGPKPRDYDKEAEATAKRLDKRNTIRSEVGLSSTSPSTGLTNPAGAPPLDWWNIPPEEKPDEKKITSKAPSGISKGSDAGERQTWRTEGNAPPLDWWNIPPGGYEGSHYAVFPPELCVKPIKAMCPEKVCNVCGEPSRRIVEPDALYAEIKSKKAVKAGGAGHNDSVGWTGLSPRAAMSDGTPFTGARFTTTGFTDCGHDDWRPGLVLDPFGGSGTTALVATGHGRDCILIDLDARNYNLALERVGPFILELGEI